MKYWIWIAAILIVGCNVSEFSGIGGSGKLVTKEIATQEFAAVDAAGAITVDIARGEKSTVVVTADDNLWDKLDARVENGILHIGLKPGSYHDTHVSAKITVPHLRSLTIAGASHGTVSAIEDPAHHLDVHVIGASTLDGDVQSSKLRLDLSGASSAKLSGTADALELSVSGASHASLVALKSHSTHANVSGASSADVAANESIDYDVSGASHLSYAGGPAVRHGQTSGASSAGGVN